MKKLVISIISAIIITLFAQSVFAADIEIISPSISEMEISPGRDFYVVGTIDRGGLTAQQLPLNIRIELFDANGVLVRSIISKVAPNGVTPAEFYLTDYESGYSLNDEKGVNFQKFTPPDLIFDGNDRNTIKDAYNKIVVKENYFAAIIYGGATKDFDLNFVDEHETVLKDIKEGTYTLAVTALNAGNDEVGHFASKLKFGNDCVRLISDEKDIPLEFISSNGISLSNSIVGKWTPEKYFDEKNEYEYIITDRYLKNIIAEYSQAKKVNILLNNIDLNTKETNYKIGSIFEENSSVEKAYSYYDIGKNEIEFSFNGDVLKKEGNLVLHEKQQFVEITRAESEKDGVTTIDFNANDGFILTEGVKTTFYGVYTPFIQFSELKDGAYKLNDRTYKVKLVITDKNNKTVYTTDNTPGLLTDNTKSQYEFSISVTPDSSFMDKESLQMNVILYDIDGKVFFTGGETEVKISGNDKFISGYDANYWGKAFCDTINLYGQNPSGKALTPDEFITRGSFASMINNLFGYSKTSDAEFSDLEKDNVYYDVCNTAQTMGYMTGDEHSRVKADEFISREQAMIVLSRIAKPEKGDYVSNFTDSEDISFWAKDAVDLMCSTGIVTGFDGKINPKDSITVAEASALIIKTIKWMHGALDTTNSVVITKPDVSVDLSEIELIDTEFVENNDEESVTAFFSKNNAAFVSIVNYLTDSNPAGIYIKKVGNGLEVRDYDGKYVVLDDVAVKVITQIAHLTNSLTIKYNPVAEDAFYFSFGKNSLGKDTGVVYTSLESLKGKTLMSYMGGWYYYTQN